MKKLITIVVMMFTLTSFAQYGFRMPKKEHFIINVHLDYPETLNPEKK